MRYLFIVVGFMGISWLAHAKITTDSTRYPAHAEFTTNSIKYISGTQPFTDSIGFSDKILKAYEYLEAYNAANDKEGRADENIYVIDPDAFEPADNAEGWVFIQKKLASDPIKQKINTRLAQFNSSRNGIDSNTGKEKDGLVIYAILFPFYYEAYMKTKTVFFPKDHINNNLKDYFDQDQIDKIISFDNKVLQEIDRIKKLVASRHSKRIIYSFVSSVYYMPDTKDHRSYWYQYLDIDADPEGETETEKKEEVDSRLVKLSKQIINTADLNSVAKSAKTYSECISQAIESIILAIDKVYDGKGNANISSDKNTASSNCSKTGTWPMSEDKYKDALKRFSVDNFALGQDEESNVRVDSPENFKSSLSDKVFPDKTYILEKFPELLKLMQSNYTIVTRFAEVDCYIPSDERPKFAKTLYESIGYSDKIILVAVPYYTCTEDQSLTDTGISETITNLSSLNFMPAVYTPDAALNDAMNEPFRKTADFSDAFDAAFANVPKNHLSIVVFFSPTGQAICPKPELKENAVGFSNLVDVYALVDDRVNELKPYLNACSPPHNMGPLDRDDNGKPVIRYYESNPLHAPFLACLKSNSEAIRKILNREAHPTFSELGSSGKCTLRQSELLEDGAGAALATTYAMALAHDAGIVFFLKDGDGLNVQVNGSTLNDPGQGTWFSFVIDDSHFYGKVNPIRSKALHDLAMKAVLVGSVVAGFFGPAGMLFDAASGMILLGVGENEAAATAFVGVIIPGALTEAFKITKGATGAVREFKQLMALRTDAYVNQILAREVVARSATGGLLIIPAEVGEMAALVGDRCDYLRRLGMADTECLGILKNADPQAIQKIEQAAEKELGLARVADGNVERVTQGSIPISKANDVANALNNPKKMQGYITALQQDPNLDLVEFLYRGMNQRYKQALKFNPALTLEDFNKIEAIVESSKIFPFSTSALEAATKLKGEAGWTTIIVDGIVDGKAAIRQADNSLLPIDDEFLMNYLAESGETHPIRIITLEPGSSAGADGLAERLAQKYNTKTKSAIGDIEIGDDGLIKMKSGLDVEWAENDFRLANPDEMFHFLPDHKSHRVFTFMPHKILPDGSIVCMEAGKEVTYTVEEIADLLKKNGLRGDETIQIGLVENGYALPNFENLPGLTKKLNTELGNPIQYVNDKSAFIDPVDLTFKSEIPWTTVGEKKPLMLLTEANHDIAETDAFTVVVKGMSNGKVSVYRPQLQKVEDLTATEFAKELQTVGSDAAVNNKPIRIVSEAGVENNAQAQKFIEDVTQQTKRKVEAIIDPIQVPDGAPIPTKDLPRFTFTPISDGRYFLQKNFTGELWEKLNRYDKDFLEQLGLGLSQNNGKYIKPFKDNLDDWLKVLSNDYQKYGKVSLPTFTNIRSISTRLGGMELPDALVSDLYNNPLYAKTLDTQLKSISKTDVQKLIDDSDLFDEAKQFVKSETMPGKHTLSYFMATKGLEEKLPQEVVEALKQRYGGDEFLVFVNQQLDAKVTEPLADKFKKFCQDDPNFLDDFKTAYKKQLQNPSDADLPTYILKYEGKAGELAETRAFELLETDPKTMEFIDAARLPGKYTSLNQNEEAILRYFAAQGNHDVNDAIIMNKITDLIEAQKTIVNKALDKLPKYDGVVYRGAGSIESKANSKLLDLDPSATLEFNQYLYTSKNAEKAAKYMNSGGDQGFMMYEIKPKTAVDISDISPTSADWEELISPAKTKYRVVSRTEKNIDGIAVDYVVLEEL